MKNDENKKPILEMIGSGLDIENGNFHSPDLVKRYYNGYMSQSDEEQLAKKTFLYKNKLHT